MPEIILDVAMMLLGIVAHYLKKMMESQQVVGRRVSIRQYFLDHPLASIQSLVFASAAGIMLYWSGELDPASAFFAAYFGDSIVNARSERGQAVAAVK